jgi:arsenate reductase
MSAEGVTRPATSMRKIARILFVCTHNSARSQMAEGFLRHHASDGFEACSAGTKPGALRPLAVQVMAEEGIDISRQRAKSIDAFVEEPFDYVVTVCDDANETCPVFPNARQRLHWGFPDPSQARGTPDERLAVFRAVRDAIRARVEQFVASTLHKGDPSP